MALMHAMLAMRQRPTLRPKTHSPGALRVRSALTLPVTRRASHNRQESPEADARSPSPGALRLPCLPHAGGRCEKHSQNRQSFPGRQRPTVREPFTTPTIVCPSESRIFSKTNSSNLTWPGCCPVSAASPPNLLRRPGATPPCTPNPSWCFPRAKGATAPNYLLRTCFRPRALGKTAPKARFLAQARHVQHETLSSIRVPIIL